MSMLSFGIKLLLSKGAKKLAQETGVGKIDMTGKALKQAIPNWTLADKIADLKTDHSLSMDYVRSLIAQAKDPKDLALIQSYLASPRNNLPNNTTITLMKSALNKMHDAKWQEHLLQLKKEYLANHHDTLTAIFDHVKEMI